MKTTKPTMNRRWKTPVCAASTRRSFNQKQQSVGTGPLSKKTTGAVILKTKLPDRRAAQRFEQTPAKPASPPDISLARQHSPASPVDIQPIRKHASHAQISTASQPAFHRQPARYIKPPEDALRRFLYGMRLRAIRDIQISRGGSPFGWRIDSMPVRNPSPIRSARCPHCKACSALSSRSSAL